jgi:mannose-6-phosphate isomerase-like protein (cupin superfamily)
MQWMRLILLCAVISSATTFRGVLAQTADPSPGTTVETAPAREIPRYRTLVRGLLVREVFQTGAQDRGYSVEVWGMLVGPGQRTDETKLDADAILLVRSGRGIMTIDGENNELRLGSSYSIPAGRSFRVENFDEAAPISLRGVILRRAG